MEQATSLISQPVFWYLFHIVAAADKADLDLVYKACLDSAQSIFVGKP